MREPLNVERLGLARTARTYPVDARTLLRTIEEAVHKLPRWDLESSSGSEVRAVRRARLGCGNEVTVRLVRLESGDHTNTLAKFEVHSCAGLWDFGWNRRSLEALTRAVDKNLKPET